MRLRVMFISLCLLLAGTAFVPGVEASTGDDCQKPSSTGVHKACGKYWVVNNTVACVWNGYWEETSAKYVIYREYKCSGPDPR